MGVITRLPFILVDSVSYPPEYTIPILLWHEWASVTSTAGLVPILGLNPIQTPESVSSKTDPETAEGAFELCQNLILWI